jgi:hypothetical protein
MEVATSAGAGAGVELFLQELKVIETAVAIVNT